MNCTFKIDQGAAVVGEVVSGSLSIKAIKTIKTTSLNIRLHGKELTSAIVSSKDGKDKTVKENDTFLNLKVPVAEDDLQKLGCQLTRADDEDGATTTGSGQIKPGVYKIPFSFQLPSDIPSSCKLGEYESQASIVYTLRATFGAGAEDYQTKSEVQVNSAPAVEADLEDCHTPGIVEPSCQAISKNGLANKGKMFFGARLKQTRLQRGQKNTPIRVAVINDSAAKLHRMEFAIEQVAKWKVAPKDTGKKVKPQQRIVILSRNIVALPRKYASKIDEATRAERTNDKNRKTNNNNEIKQAIHAEDASKDDLALDFILPSIPQSAADTQQTTKINARHNIVITLMTEGNKTNPIFRVPISIVRGSMGSNSGSNNLNGTTTSTSELDASNASAATAGAAPTDTSPPVSPSSEKKKGGKGSTTTGSSPKRRTIKLGNIKLF